MYIGNIYQSFERRLSFIFSFLLIFQISDKPPSDGQLDPNANIRLYKDYKK